MATPYSVVLVTAPNDKSAKGLARMLVQKRLAACVNLSGKIASIYRWKGKIEEASERLMIIKTRQALVGKLTRAVRRNHPYTVPEIIALPVQRGDKAYLDWVGESTS